MSIRLSKEASLFRNELIFCPDVKTIDLEHTLTNLFMQIRHEGRRVKTAFKGEYTLDTIVNYMRNQEKEGFFSGVEQFPEYVKTWIRCNLANLAFRGNYAREKFSALRPLHLESFLVQNVKHNRDYFSADQLYYMLRVQPEILERLKTYLSQGYDVAMHELQAGQKLDIDTVALLHLIKKLEAQVDIRTQPQVRIIKPFLTEQAKLFADDTLRLLAYQEEIPRNVMMEYFRILSGFHLALYFFKLIYLLPKMLQAGTRKIADDWSMVIDVSGLLDSSMSSIACKDMENQLNGLNAYIRAGFAFNAVRNRLSISDPGHQDDVDYILNLAKNPPEGTNAFYELLLKQIYDQTEEEDERTALQNYLQYEPDIFAKYISVLQKVRGSYLYGEGKKFIDSVSMKNSGSALMLGGKSRKHARRGTLGSKLLELLIQLLVLKNKSDGSGFETQPLSVQELIAEIRKRYGLIIDGTCEERFKNADVKTHIAFRDNVNELKNKLRQIGFYTDLSDAGSLQKINPRYQVKSC